MDDVIQEIKIRSRISSIYNRRLEDFDSREGYDSYLEEVEDIIYNLANKIDVRETEAKVESYQRQNRLQIQLNQARQIEEQLSKVRQESEIAITFASTAVPGTAASGYKPDVALAVALPMPMEQVAMDAEGNLVQRPQLSRTTLQAAAAATASGWSIELHRKRAWQEAFTSVFIF